jgi:hypothetical protein
MKKQIPADTILSSIDTWFRHGYRAWCLERDIEVYANGGPPPCEDPNYEGEIVPLGFAQSFMKNEMAPLVDAYTQEPGVIDCVCINPALNIPERTPVIQTQIGETLNKVIMPRLEMELRNLAGRSTVTGRGVLFRKSPNDIILKCGRIIAPQSAGLDILDSEFREWAFPGQITLRDIDTRLKGAQTGMYGWNRAGLEQLKLWILSTESMKYGVGRNGDGGVPDWAAVYNRDTWLGTDLTGCGYSRPVDVYWYFRKNGEITKKDPRFGGHEKVDLYCISRFGSEKSIVSQMYEANVEAKALGITYNKDFERHLKDLQKDELEKDKAETCNERLLFYVPDIFRSVEECLILHVDDAAVSGENRLAEVKGTGKTAMPKLAVMEQLLTSIIEGLTFGAQPNWTVRNGVDNEYLKQLQRGGLRSGQAFPDGIKPMEKQNSFSGFSHAMGFVRMLDAGTSADSAAGAQGVFGGNQAEFAAQANADLANRAQTANQRVRNWFKTLDKVVEMICRTICMDWPKMKQEYPCYYDAQRMRIILRTRYGIHEDEWSQDRWDYPARRLAGGVMRQQAVAFNSQMLATVAPYQPTLIPLLVREIVRAGYGDTIANQWLNPPPEAKLAQEELAYRNATVAIMTGAAPPAKPGDDPMVHSGKAMEVLAGRVQAAQATGSITMVEVIGLMALIQYISQFLRMLPEQYSEPAFEKLGEQAGTLKAIPVQKPLPEGAMTEKEQMEVQIKMENQQRLKEEAARKAKDNEIRTMIDMRKLAGAENMQKATEQTLATQRAKTTVDIQKTLNDIAQPTEPALPGLAGLPL